MTMASQTRTGATSHSGWNSGDGRDYDDDTCRIVVPVTSGLYYYTYTYGFSLPDGINVDGVRIRHHADWAGGGNITARVRLCNGTTPIGSETSSQFIFGSNPCGTTLWTHGGATDKWGLSQSALNAAVLASDFGVLIRNVSTNGTFELREDGFEVTVYYTVTDFTRRATVAVALTAEVTRRSEIAATGEDESTRRASVAHVALDEVTRRSTVIATEVKESTRRSTVSVFSGIEAKSGATNHSGWVAGDGRVYDDDNCRTKSTFTSEWYYTYTYGFAIPSETIVQGVQIEHHYAQSGSTGTRAFRVQLCDGVTLQGSYVTGAGNLGDCAGALARTHGSSTYLWGMTAEALDTLVRSGNFGVAVYNDDNSPDPAKVAQEDGFRITVWFTRLYDPTRASKVDALNEGYVRRSKLDILNEGYVRRGKVDALNEGYVRRSELSVLNEGYTRRCELDIQNEGYTRRAQLYADLSIVRRARLYVDLSIVRRSELNVLNEGYTRRAEINIFNAGYTRRGEVDIENEGYTRRAEVSIENQGYTRRATVDSVSAIGDVFREARVYAVVWWYIRDRTRRANLFVPWANVRRAEIQVAIEHTKTRAAIVTVSSTESWRRAEVDVYVLPWFIRSKTRSARVFADQGGDTRRSTVLVCYVNTPTRVSIINVPTAVDITARAIVDVVVSTTVDDKRRAIVDAAIVPWFVKSQTRRSVVFADEGGITRRARVIVCELKESVRRSVLTVPTTENVRRRAEVEAFAIPWYIRSITRRSKIGVSVITDVTRRAELIVCFLGESTRRSVVTPALLVDLTRRSEVTHAALLDDKRRAKVVVFQVPWFTRSLTRRAIVTVELSTETRRSEVAVVEVIDGTRRSVVITAGTDVLRRAKVNAYQLPWFIRSKTRRATTDVVVLTEPTRRSEVFSLRVGDDNRRAWVNVPSEVEITRRVRVTVPGGVNVVRSATVNVLVATNIIRKSKIEVYAGRRSRATSVLTER